MKKPFLSAFIFSSILYSALIMLIFFNIKFDKPCPDYHDGEGNILPEESVRIIVECHYVNCDSLLANRRTRAWKEIKEAQQESR